MVGQSLNLSRECRNRRGMGVQGVVRRIAGDDGYLGTTQDCLIDGVGKAAVRFRKRFVRIVKVGKVCDS
jgi:hypothetical protein